MATSIRLDEKTKREFDRVQAEERLRTGKRLSQSELLARLVRHFRETGGGHDLDDEWVPWTPAQIKALMAHAGKGGEIGSSTDIDEVLYSDEAVFGRKRR